MRYTFLKRGERHAKTGFTPSQGVNTLGEEPDSLYLYGSNMAVSASVLEAVYDGPIDQRSFAGALRPQNTAYLSILLVLLALALAACGTIEPTPILQTVVVTVEGETVVKTVTPYTKALLSAVPVPDPTYEKQEVKIVGGITKPINPIARCRFYERCPLADMVCETNDHPPLELRVDELEHYSACYHADLV